MKYLYYPGCSQKGTSRCYEESMLAVASKLNIEFEELDDWNCCGTTTVIAVNKVLSLALAARNLALAEPSGLPLVTPCPSCWLSLTKANMVLGDGGRIAEDVRAALAAGGLTYGGTTRVHHLLQFLIDEIGIARLEKSVTTPLTGLRVAPYYGCQLVRPYAPGDDVYDPQNLERVIEATGAEATAFQLKTACCGGSMMATQKDMGGEMSGKILRNIRDAGADLVVTACPLCQLNLELVQYGKRSLGSGEATLPILNVTQLIGLAMGISHRELGFSRLLLPNVERSITQRQEQMAETVGR
jgi:heterodisulfide reductase subunit B